MGPKPAPPAADGGDQGARGGVTRKHSPALVDKTLRFVRVFYGTNRAREQACVGASTVRWDGPEDGCVPNGFYGGKLAHDAGDGTYGLELGTVSVTFPPDHATGKIERPLEVFSFSLDEDPDDHVIISDLRSYGTDHGMWVAALQMAERDHAFVYVHGFETTFDEAARRAAQLAYDLDFDLEEDFRGVPMLFSWPSRGKVGGYAADEDSARESVAAFDLFLDRIKKDAGIAHVHVIAHSMGNRVVGEALYARSLKAEPPLLDQLVLAAPDVWARTFKDRFLRALPTLAERVTLYVSDHDKALATSRHIRMGEPRAGEVAGGLLEASEGVDRFDAVNASNIPAGLLDHGYYANTGSMLSDIYCLLKGTPAPERPLLTELGSAWQFRPPEELAGIDPGECRVPEPWRRFPWVFVGAAVAMIGGVFWVWRRVRRRRR